MIIDFGNDKKGGGGSCSLQELSLTYTTNGTNEIVPEAGYDGVSKATVTVEVPDPELEALTDTITENGAKSYTPTKYGYSKVDITVDVPTPEPVLEELKATTNGSYTPQAPAVGYSKVDVNVENVKPVEKIVMKDWYWLRLSNSFFDPDRLNMFDFTGVKEWANMFKEAHFSGLPDGVLDLYDVSKDATQVNNMFQKTYGAAEIRFDLRKCSYLDTLFEDNSSLKKIIIDCPECVNMSSCFGGCIELSDLTINNTGKVEDFSYCFNYCYALATIKGTLDMTSCTNADNIFGSKWGSNTTLTTFTMVNLGTDLEIITCKALDKPSLLSIINTAQDVTAEPKTLTLSAEMFALLSDEEKAPMIAKGWSIVQG